MAKIVKFDSEARSAMLRGVDVLANTVKVTLGPPRDFGLFNNFWRAIIASSLSLIPLWTTPHKSI